VGEVKAYVHGLERSWVFGNECRKLFDSSKNWHRVCRHRNEHHRCHERVFISSRFVFVLPRKATGKSPKESEE
jgi:hypothetical protein